MFLGRIVFSNRNEFLIHRFPKLAGKHFAIISSDGIRAKHQGCFYGSELKQPIEVRQEGHLAPPTHRQMCRWLAELSPIADGSERDRASLSDGWFEERRMEWQDLSSRSARPLGEKQNALAVAQGLINKPI